MTKSFPVMNLVTIFVFVLIVGAALVIGLAGPTGPIPVHFNMAGLADRSTGRGEVAAGVGSLAPIALILSFYLGRRADLVDGDNTRRRGLAIARLLILLTSTLVAGLFAVLTFSANGTALAGILMAGIGILLASSGAFMGRVAPNRFVGVRTPWTHKSRLAWDRSNRLAGRLLFFGGIAAMIAAPFSPQPIGMIVLIVGVLLAAGWPVIESRRVWRNDPNP